MKQPVDARFLSSIARRAANTDAEGRAELVIATLRTIAEVSTGEPGTLTPERLGISRVIDAATQHARRTQKQEPGE